MRKKILAGVAAVAIAVGLSIALAGSAGAQAPAPALTAGQVKTGQQVDSSLIQCTNNATNVVYSAQGPSCPAGYTAFRWHPSTMGTTGKTGATGATGPSGVTAVTTKKFDEISSVAAGGKFVDLSTQVGTVDLQAGTYMISFNAKVKPNGVTAADIFPQFFVYDQAKNANFDGNLFNIGAGALEPGTTTHDSYFSGSSLVTLTAAKTIHVYAFGYLADNGASTYDLETAQLDVVKITPAS